MPATRSFYLTLLCLFLAAAFHAGAATVNATWNAASDVPVTAASYTATGNTVNFTLNFAPATGTNLTVVNNTGLPFISGAFDNLVQGQTVMLSYGGVTYNFVAHYYGGTGNDLMLVWANSHVFAWGYNNAQQLGCIYTQQTVTVPVPVVTAGTPLANRTVLALSAGSVHSLALCSDGSLTSWGANSYGELGNSTTTTSNRAVAVTTASTPLAGKTVVAISAGSTHNLALCSDGSLASWGGNSYGQLGNNTTTNSTVPVAVTTTGTPLAGKSVVAICAGDGHSLALCSDGTLTAWGYNASGQLGNNTAINSSVPVAVVTAGTPLAGKTVVSIAAGTNHSLALCSDGTLITWGSNSAGQLGNGTTTSSSVPVAVTTVGTPLAGKTVVAMNAGAYHSLALCSDGTLVAWGINVSGQLGNSTKANSSVPVAVTTSGILAGKTVTSVAAGSMHSLANCTDGTPVAWGFNALGELGNGSTTNSSSPVATITGLLTSGEKFIQVASGQHAQHSLGLAATPFPIVSTLAPTTVGTTTAVVNGTVNANEGASAPSFNYGLDSSYGMNMPGTPASVTGSSPTAVSATLTGLLPNTTYHYQMVGASSSTSTGGADMTFTTLNGNLAGLTASTGSFSPSFSPSIYSYRGAVGAAVSSVVVTPTTSDSNATVAVNGTPVVSGSSSSPLPLGYGDTTINIVVTASDNISTVTYTLIITRDAPSTLNAVFSSATDIPLVSNGMVATGDTVNFTLNYTPTPGTSLTVVNNTGLGFIQGKYSNLAHGDVVNLTYNGITYHFVASYYGGTGNDLVLNWAGTRLVAWGDYSTSSIPMAVPATGTPLANHTVLALSAGNRFSLALFSDGTLASWGYNGDGELGNNTTTATSTPGVLATAGGPLVGKVVVAVSSGYYHSLVLCSDGSMASWGLNFNGQLGNSAFPNNATVPVPVVTSGTPLASKSVVAIAAGYGHNLVLCDDGTLAAWGLNSNGQLGNNTTDINRNYTPVLVTITGTPLAGKTVVSIAAGQYHNIALCSDGTVVTWGYNQFGQLGNSTPPYSSVPVAVNTSVVLAGKTVTAVAAGASHCLALCSDGTIAAWGNNAYGQLGNNMTTNSSVPVAVTTDGTPLAGKTIVRLMAGYYHSMVQCSDGTLVSWGDNGAGELGNSTVSSISSIPVAVDTSALASAESFVLATTSSNANGCLGLVSSPIPTVTTLAVTSVGATTAVLNGTVNANGGSSMVSFDYGLDTSYGINLAGTPTSITGTGSTAISTSLTSLTPSTTYHFRANGGSYSGSDLTFTTLSQLQNWRQQSFGTTTTTGLMADTADYDGDGIPNLLEFALNLNPTSASVLPVNGAVNGANFEYTYSRSSSAANAGTSYQVQWSSTLPATWSSIGVTQVILSDDTTTQQIKAYVPMNGAATMFVRLSVTAPP